MVVGESVCVRACVCWLGMKLSLPRFGAGGSAVMVEVVSAMGTVFLHQSRGDIGRAFPFMRLRLKRGARCCSHVYRAR